MRSCGSGFSSTGTSGVFVTSSSFGDAPWKSGFAAIASPDLDSTALKLESQYDRGLNHALPGSPATAGLRQRKWNCADAQKQKQVKRTSNQMRFDGGIKLLFHLFGPRDFEMRKAVRMKLTRERLSESRGICPG